VKKTIIAFLKFSPRSQVFIYFFLWLHEWTLDVCTAKDLKLKGDFSSLILENESYNELAYLFVPGVIVPGGGAIDQLNAAYEALITQPDYAESVGLLQVVNFDAGLAGLPEQIVTVFLPNNEAYFTLPVSTVDLIFATDNVLNVSAAHVVIGYHDAAQLSKSPQNLTTISGLGLTTRPVKNQVLVGPLNAVVVAPNLYKVEGKLVIHGINGLLIPPGL
jgi:hypothetical protein